MSENRIIQNTDKKNIIIYGARLVALECYREICVSGNGDRVVGFAVSDRADNPNEILDKPVRLISDYVSYKDEALVIIAMPAKYHNEVENHARNLGFKNFRRISLELLSQIKGDRFINEHENSLPFKIRKSENDPTWLDAYADGSQGKIRCKYPTLFFLEENELINKSLDLYREYFMHIGNVSDIKTLTTHHFNFRGRNIGELLQIHMVFDSSVSDFVKAKSFDPWVKKLHVGGTKEKYEFDTAYDVDCEESVSERNMFLAEMTGAYWIWKQAKASKYKGLCHYRRHFDLTEDLIFNMEEEKVDVLLTTPRYAPGGIQKMFEAETPVSRSVFENMLKAMGDERDGFEAYLKKKYYFPNNMVVAKSEIYDEYCAFVFPILMQMLKNDIENRYGHEGDRHIAYAAELLTSYYFIKRANELKTIFTDYIFYG